MIANQFPLHNTSLIQCLAGHGGHGFIADACRADAQGSTGADALQIRGDFCQQVGEPFCPDAVQVEGTEGFLCNGLPLQITAADTGFGAAAVNSGYEFHGVSFFSSILLITYGDTW